MPDTNSQNEKVSDTFSSRGLFRKYPIKKILLAVVLAFVIVGIVVSVTAVIFPQIPGVIILKMKFPESRVPGAYQKLSTRGVNPQVFTKDTKELSYCDVKFRSPGIVLIGDASPPPESEVKGCITILDFSSDVRIAISATKVDYISDFQGDNPEDAEEMRTLFGDQLYKSNYNFVKEVLKTNIDEITILTPRKDAIPTLILFNLKIIYVAGHPSESGIFNFEQSNVKGFQFGNPNVSNKVGLLFYNEDTKTEITFAISGLNQEEIDFIINSININ